MPIKYASLFVLKSKLSPQNFDITHKKKRNSLFSRGKTLTSEYILHNKFLYILHNTIFQNRKISNYGKIPNFGKIVMLQRQLYPPFLIKCDSSAIAHLNFFNSSNFVSKSQLTIVTNSLPTISLPGNSVKHSISFQVKTLLFVIHTYPLLYNMYYNLV